MFPGLILKVFIAHTCKFGCGIMHYSVCMHTQQRTCCVCVCTKLSVWSLRCSHMLGDRACVWGEGGGGNKGWSRRDVKRRY